MLSVIMLNVIMLSVVAPRDQCLKTFWVRKLSLIVKLEVLFLPRLSRQV